MASGLILKLPLSMAAEMLATFSASNSALTPLDNRLAAVLDSAIVALALPFASLAGRFAAAGAEAVAAAARVASLGA